MEATRCAFGIFVILAFCSISTVRGDDWDELELEDRSEARIFSTNSTSLPDAYVSLVNDSLNVIGFGIILHKVCHTATLYICI